MLIFAAHMISFVIGYLLLNLVLRREPENIRPTIPILAYGLGIGCSGLITFLSFIVYDQFNRLLIINIHYAVIIILLSANLLMNVKPFIARLITILSLKGQHWGVIFLWILWLLIVPALYFFAHTHPFGEWDAWALWNMKTKFLIYSGTDWQALFRELHWHTQPDYPILLPLFNVWVHAFSQAQLQIITLWTAISLSLATAILLYYGSRQFMHGWHAAIASLILLYHPYYIFLATAQYADILLAYYLLAALSVLLLALRSQNLSTAYLGGLFLGLLTFTKNEGVVMAFLLIILTGAYLFTPRMAANKSNRRIFYFAALGMLTTALATIYFKIFLAPPNRDILANLNVLQLKFLNVAGLKLIFQAIAKEIFDKKWSFIWYFFCFAFIVGLPKFFKNECKIITGFFIIFFISILFIYLTTTNFELTWRLENTLSRIFFYLMPSLLFINIYAYYHQRS